MDKNPDHKRAVEYLYPPISPFDQRVLDVGDGHRVYVEQCGNPEGRPVVVLHGGPGGGCSPAMRRYFDPKKFRVILFDQRGCGRSRPHASVEANTTWHLVDDIERIRTMLEIENWDVFGGSWGATLALIYAISHPTRVTSLALRGVFLSTQAELDWFYGGGAGKFWPEPWERFTELVPRAEQGDLIAAYHKRLFSGHRATEVKFAQAWGAWENGMASVQSAGHGNTSPPDYARAFARLENHYFMNKGFLDHDGWILDNVDRIQSISGVIVQGRYDMICPPSSAYALSTRWTAGKLVMVSNAGHALSEPGISAELVRFTNSLPRY